LLPREFVAVLVSALTVQRLRVREQS
jgi:hypothetical protein